MNFKRNFSPCEHSRRLEMLDGKQITENSRQFLMSWKASREAQQSKEKVQSNLTDRGKYNEKETDQSKNILAKNQRILFYRIFVLRSHVFHL